MWCIPRTVSYLAVGVLLLPVGSIQHFQQAGALAGLHYTPRGFSRRAGDEEEHVLDNVFLTDDIFFSPKRQHFSRR